LSLLAALVLLATSGAASAYCVANTGCDSLSDLQRRVDDTLLRMQMEDRLRTLQAGQDRFRHRIEAEQSYSEARIRMLRSLQRTQAPGPSNPAASAAAPAPPPHGAPAR